MGATEAGDIVMDELGMLSATVQRLLLIIKSDQELNKWRFSHRFFA